MAQPSTHASTRRAEQAAHVQRDQRGVDLLPVLVRDQHIVHQRHGQVGRNHVRGRCPAASAGSRAAAGRGTAGRSATGGTASRSTAACGSPWCRSGIHPGPAPAAPCSSGRRSGRRPRRGMPSTVALQLRLELIDHAHCQQVLAQREAPGRQPAVPAASVPGGRRRRGRGVPASCRAGKGQSRQSFSPGARASTRRSVNTTMPSEKWCCASRSTVIQVTTFSPAARCFWTASRHTSGRSPAALSGRSETGCHRAADSRPGRLRRLFC